MLGMAPRGRWSFRWCRRGLFGEELASSHEVSSRLDEWIIFLLGISSSIVGWDESEQKLVHVGAAEQTSYGIWQLLFAINFCLWIKSNRKMKRYEKIETRVWNSSGGTARSPDRICQCVCRASTHLIKINVRQKKSEIQRFT
jgi:hypothetical protein